MNVMIQYTLVLFSFIMVGVSIICDYIDKNLFTRKPILPVYHDDGLSKHNEPSPRLIKRSPSYSQILAL